ncbi:TetR/AcrR family transcriptional regulator [Metapseudomonas furukawaii]|uniref:TetR/AcrR family transcriptional regulator n=1 Tax=Metapseudomonas furukawaii TaxID=1149133 RepID=UPI004045CCB0
MVSKARRPRGRPRSYDPDTVLDQVLTTFWRQGYSRTTLDDLAAASGMNRPSLYAGFGDKRSLYIKAMYRFRDRAKAHFEQALHAQPNDASFADVIERYLRAAIELESGHPETGVCGCAVISTASAEALADSEIRKVLDGVLRDMDKQLHARLCDALAGRELPPGTDIETLGFLLTSTAHSIGIRARAGHLRQEAERLARPIALTLAKQVGLHA